MILFQSTDIQESSIHRKIQNTNNLDPTIYPINHLIPSTKSKIESPDTKSENEIHPKENEANTSGVQTLGVIAIFMFLIAILLTCL